MSQAKVDRYKEEKKNRAKIMAREKRRARLWKAGGTVCVALLAVWLGYSVYTTIHPANTSTETETVSYTVDTSALSDYIDALD